MALRCGERVLETSTTEGTGSFTLLGAVAGYQTFLLGVGNGNTTYYLITDGTNWEKGIGTYTSAGTSLSRDTVYESSAGGAKVSFPAGTKNVFSDAPANLFDGTLASSINAASLGGSTEADLLARANHTGTQAYTTITGKTWPSGALVGTTDVQVLSSKTLSTPLINDALLNAPYIDGGELLNPVLTTSISGTAFLDEDNMASNSATKVASQQSIKAYVDNSIAALTLGAKIHLGTFTSSGSTQAITGVGFTPKAVVFLGWYSSGGNNETSIGISDVTHDYCIEQRIISGTPGFETSATLSIYLNNTGGNTVQGQVSAFGADGFTVTWVANDFSATVYYLAIG